MEFKHKIAVTALTLALLASTTASSWDVGESLDGGTFIYDEPLEGVYSNGWTAYLLMSKEALEAGGQARLTIIGEGKSVEFIGNVSINCENGAYSWQSGNNFSDILATEEDIKNVVPQQAIKNAVKLFCK